MEGGGHSSRKALGSQGWPGRLSSALLAYLREEGLNSSLWGSWPATWPHLAGLLSPRVTAAWALLSVKHFLLPVQSGTGNLLSHRPWPAKAAKQHCKMPSSLLSSLLFLPRPSSLFSAAILLFPSTLLASFPPFHRPFMRHLLSVVTSAFTDMQMLRSSHLVLLPGLRSRQSSGYEVVLYHNIYKGGRSEVTYMLRRMAKGVEASC